MAHAHRSSSQLLRRALVQALVICLIPAGSAFAQVISLVRVASEKIAITSSQHGKGNMLMTASRGTVFQVIYTEGDRYNHRKSNWYWVLLPRDAYGTQPPGWISGDDVEYVPPAETTKRAPAQENDGLVMETAQLAKQSGKTAEAVESGVRQPSADPMRDAEPGAAAGRPALSEVILNFDFDKSDLTDDAKSLLDGAVALLKSSAAGISFALEGYADSIGTEPYNDRLGLARAETVKRRLAEQHHIPADKITVVSYGENRPAASNATSEGRAQNRRVVVKVGA